MESEKECKVMSMNWRNGERKLREKNEYIHCQSMENNQLTLSSETDECGRKEQEEKEEDQRIDVAYKQVWRRIKGARIE